MTLWIWAKRQFYDQKDLSQEVYNPLNLSLFLLLCDWETRAWSIEHFKRFIHCFDIWHRFDMCECSLSRRCIHFVCGLSDSTDYFRFYIKKRWYLVYKKCVTWTNEKRKNEKRKLMPNSIFQRNQIKDRKKRWSWNEIKNSKP